MSGLSDHGAAGAMAALLLIYACGGSAGPTSMVTISASLEGHAAEFAASAERALDETVFEALGPGVITDVVVGLCEGLGMGAIEATIDGLGIEVPASDREILTEVLIVGMTQVCSDRASVDVTGFYLDAVGAAAQEANAMGVFDEGHVIRAASVVCETLQSGQGAETVLLAVVDSLFEVKVESLDKLDDLINIDQGIVSGAVLASATALLCPEHAGEVEAFIESL